MKKEINKLLIWQVASGGIFLLIVSPLILSVYQYEFSDHQISFQQSLFDVYNLLLPPKDINIFLLNVTISVIGVLAGTILYRYRKTKMVKELTTSQLLNLIEKGENEKVEFKSSLRYDYRQVKINKNLEDVIVKSIAVFLNNKGGILIIGVNDYGEILGLANDYWSLKIKAKDGFEQRLMLIISNTFGKDICSKIHLTFHRIEDKEICSILIDRSKRPVYVKENNQTTFFLRTGNVTNPLSTSETVEYLESKKHLMGS
jgi:Predicted transcriptional regulator containing an HTH domain and an uncharacterized domain shared with the mammalian protein Schlafen